MSDRALTANDGAAESRLHGAAGHVEVVHYQLSVWVADELASGRDGATSTGINVMSLAPVAVFELAKAAAASPVHDIRVLLRNRARRSRQPSW